MMSNIRRRPADRERGAAELVGICRPPRPVATSVRVRVRAGLGRSRRGAEVEVPQVIGLGAGSTVNTMVPTAKSSTCMTTCNV